MNATLTEISATRKTIAVEIPALNVESAIARRVHRYRRSLEIPGFRRGRVPARIVLQRMREQILQDASEDLLYTAVPAAIQKLGQKPVSKPSIHDVVIRSGEPMTFVIAFETIPPIDVGEYRRLTLRRPPVVVTDEMVAQAVENLRLNAARIEPVTGRGIMHGDLVSAEIVQRPVGSTPGRAAKEAGAHTSTVIQIGNPSNPPGLDAQLIGLEAGAKCEFTLHLPHDYADTAVAGSDVVYNVTVTALRKRELPAVDDELAQELGEYESLEEMKSALRADLEEQLNVAADNQVRTELLGQLARRVGDVEVPRAMVERVVDEHVQRAERAASDDPMVDLDAIDWAPFRARRQQEAIETVRGLLALDEIAGREKITVTETEFEADIKQQAARAGLTEEAAHALIEQADGMDSLKIQLRREKTVRFLLAEAKIVTA